MAALQHWLPVGKWGGNWGVVGVTPVTVLEGYCSWGGREIGGVVPVSLSSLPRLMQCCCWLPAGGS